MPWGGRPQGAAPTDCLFSADYGLVEGRPQGAPLPIVFSRRLWPGKGAHKGRPYRLMPVSRIVMAGEGRPQGAPLPIVFSRTIMAGGGRPQAWVCPRLSSFGRLALGSRHPQGVPLPIDLLSAFGPGEAAVAQVWRPYRLSSFGVRGQMGEGTHKLGCTPQPMGLSLGVWPW